MTNIYSVKDYLVEPATNDTGRSNGGGNFEEAPTELEQKKLYSYFNQDDSEQARVVRTRARPSGSEGTKVEYILVDLGGDWPKVIRVACDNLHFVPLADERGSIYLKADLDLTDKDKHRWIDGYLILRWTKHIIEQNEGETAINDVITLVADGDMAKNPIFQISWPWLRHTQ